VVDQVGARETAADSVGDQEDRLEVAATAAQEAGQEGRSIAEEELGRTADALEADPEVDPIAAEEVAASYLLEDLGVEGPILVAEGARNRPDLGVGRSCVVVDCTTFADDLEQVDAGVSDFVLLRCRVVDAEVRTGDETRGVARFMRRQRKKISQDRHTGRSPHVT
jgi:hypothetical protein